MKLKNKAIFFFNYKLFYIPYDGNKDIIVSASSTEMEAITAL